MRACTVLTVAAGLFCALAQQALAMNKAELIDAISASAKLTKADAGRALDASIESISKSLKKGDKVSLVGFGSFSLVKTGSEIGPDGTCQESFGSAFVPAPTFARAVFPVGYEPDFSMRVSKSKFRGGVVTQSANGRIMSGTIHVGDTVIRDQEEGFGHDLVVGITVGGVPVTQASEGTVTLDLRSGDNTPIIRGSALRALAYPPDQDPPLSPCDSNVVDADVANDVATTAKLPVATVDAALQAMKDIIIATLLAGESVELDTFGEFYVEGRFLASQPEPGSELTKIPAGFVAKKTSGQLAGKK